MTTASSQGPALRGKGLGRGMTGLIGGFVVRRARLVLVVVMLAVVGFGVLGFGAFGKLKTGGFQDPGAESTTAQTLTDQRFGGSAGVVLLVHAEAGTVEDAPARAAGAARQPRRGHRGPDPQRTHRHHRRSADGGELLRLRHRDSQLPAAIRHRRGVRGDHRRDARTRRTGAGLPADTRSCRVVRTRTAAPADRPASAWPKPAADPSRPPPALATKHGLDQRHAPGAGTAYAPASDVMMMSLNEPQRQALGSIEDGLAGSDPRLASS